jgi:prevent-host-death family protein
MAEVGAFEAKNKLGQLLDRVEHGEEILITRRGKAVARLVPAEAARDRAHVLGAVARIRSMRKGVMLGELSIKELINEGRP